MCICNNFIQVACREHSKNLDSTDHILENGKERELKIIDKKMEEMIAKIRTEAKILKEQIQQEHAIEMKKLGEHHKYLYEFENLLEKISEQIEKHSAKSAVDILQGMNQVITSYSNVMSQTDFNKNLPKSYKESVFHPMEVKADLLGCVIHKKYQFKIPDAICDVKGDITRDRKSLRRDIKRQKSVTQ